MDKANSRRLKQLVLMLLWLAISVLQVSSVSAQSGVAPCPRAISIDLASITAEAVCLAQRYIQIDTSNPPGNETAAVDFLEAFLNDEGIQTTRFEAAPGRANVYARLRGDGSKKAFMLVHHMDVVPAEAEAWAEHPFAGVVRDGYLWGRGSLDNKGPGIMEVLSFVLLKRLEVPLKRDVVLLAVADEEQGGGKGARFIADHHFDVIADVEFALNEGGVMLQLGENKFRYGVEFAQKAPLWLEIVAEGVQGHGSRPSRAAATHRLIRALARLEQFEFPIVVTDAVQTVFAASAVSTVPAEREPYQDLRKSLENEGFRDEFMGNPNNARMVRNTLAITTLTGSPKENVLPARASAVIDLRLLPGQSPDAVIDELERAMDDVAITTRTILSSTSHAASIDTELFRAIGTLVARYDPGARVVPSFISGFTDCNTFRAKGITCYGFMPMRFALADVHLVHGRDERFATAELGRGTLLLHELVRDMVSN